jgi:hypothetical protein
VVIFGLYDPKTGSKLGLSGPKWCHTFGCNALKPKPGSNLGYGPKNGVRNGLLTQKLDLWTAFGYTGFSVYGLFGSGAFGSMGFWVYGLFGSHPSFFSSTPRKNMIKLTLVPQNAYLGSQLTIAVMYIVSMKQYRTNSFHGKCMCRHSRHVCPLFCLKRRTQYETGNE